jgi:hypothetical protein
MKKSRSLLCRASMHSFFIDCQSLRELRITSVLIIAITQKEMRVGFKCNGLIIFSQRGGASKYNTCVSRLPRPPPPRLPPSSSWFPPPFFLPPPPQLRCFWAGRLWLWCSGRGVLSREGWSVKYDRAADILDGTEP